MGIFYINKNKTKRNIDEAKNWFIKTYYEYIYILSSTELLSMREKRRRNRERGNQILQYSYGNSNFF
jgi:hypothetical protein